MNARRRSAGNERKDSTIALPGCCDEHIRIARIELNVVGAGPLIAAEYFRPRLSAVGGLVDAAVTSLSPERTLRRDVDDIGVARVDENAPNVLRLFEPGVRPALASVDRLVDAVAVRDHTLRIVL